MKKPTNEVKPKVKSKLIPIALIVAAMVIFVPFLFYFPDPDVIIIIEPTPSDDPDEIPDGPDPNLDRSVYAIIKKTYTFGTDIPILSPSSEVFFNGADGDYDVNSTEIKIKNIMASETTYFNNASANESLSVSNQADIVVVPLHIPTDSYLKNISFYAETEWFDYNRKDFVIYNASYDHLENTYRPNGEYWQEDKEITYTDASQEGFHWLGLITDPSYILEKGMYYVGIYAEWINLSTEEYVSDNIYNQTLRWNHSESSWDVLNRSVSYKIDLEPVSATDPDADFLIVAKVRTFDEVFTDVYFDFTTNDTCIFTENIKAGAHRIYFEPLFWKDVAFTFDYVVMNCSRYYKATLLTYDETSLYVEIPLNTLLGLTLDHTNIQIWVRIPTDFEIVGVYYSLSSSSLDFANEATFERDGEFIIIDYMEMGYTLRVVILKREGD